MSTKLTPEQLRRLRERLYALDERRENDPELRRRRKLYRDLSMLTAEDLEKRFGPYPIRGI